LRTIVKRFEIVCPVSAVTFPNGDRGFDVYDLDKWLDPFKRDDDDADAIVDAVSATGRALRAGKVHGRAAAPAASLAPEAVGKSGGALARSIVVALIGPVAKWHRQASPSSSPTDFTEIR
jgi:hypothetical protein